ncbi:ubiquitin-like modifier-activating enzyme ATG7 isoform X2 [Phlebotomus argentipes]|uniref:ubiquitin-like modifier-activating enzyme ATG7 isoform X2 n=1 Tax=Phlebotomus argentipes TaxID=94469 RepID=UPI0028932299|nr:ubiquitin-like modifier-activating enzyme ATG7 isoform X2 [Phlebotomus argentipes]
MDSEILQFTPFTSFVHPSFWHKLAENKINVDRLCDSAKKICGFYSNVDATNCLVEVECTAFNQEFSVPKNCFFAHGTLHNKNTIEDFKEVEKSKFLQEEGNRIAQLISSGKCLEDPSLLVNFVLLSYADLKKYKFYYWFAFPAPLEAILHVSKPPAKVTDVFTAEQIEVIRKNYLTIEDARKRSFFILEDIGHGFKIHALSDVISDSDKENNFRGTDLTKIYFGFSDPSEYANPGWQLRIFTAFLSFLCPNLCGGAVNFLSVKLKRQLTIDESVVYVARMPEKSINFGEDVKWIGWEPNSVGKYLPRVVSMADSMDPEKLAETSVNLNLKLMRWRIVPELNLDVIADTKCLLLGAGTLGCSVARNLLSWGVNCVSFVDYGNVSYSNPVRQNLFKHEDAQFSRPKAATAAKRLLEIYPALTTKGISLHIPMPGHPIGDSTREQTIKDIQTLEKLIAEHDVIYLLMDSRESRWLPTVLGNVHEKIIINAALGFDSYLVMRHGTRKSPPEPIDYKKHEKKGLKCIPGNHLGCYFCNDVTAPGNSMRDRTLDQQCTVTRPAVSNIAGSLAVELMTTLLQHELREFAPAFVVTSSANREDAEVIPEGILGVLPHSIRGVISSFEQILPATEKFPQCIACSESILAEYRKRKVDFILDALNTSKYLEDLTGITDMMKENYEDIIECMDSDLELSE